MKTENAIFFAILLAALLAIPPSAGSLFAEGQSKPHAMVIKLENSGKPDRLLLGGPPDTVSMKAGLVTLDPQHSVGKHSTRQHEEMLVVLEGQGKMLFSDGTTLALAANHVLYCPPETEHDVINTGSGILRYVYIVADTR